MQSTDPIISRNAPGGKGFLSPIEVWYTCAMRAPERLRSLLAGLSGKNEDHRLLLLLIILVALALRLARLTFQATLRTHLSGLVGPTVVSSLPCFSMRWKTM